MLGGRRFRGGIAQALLSMGHQLVFNEVLIQVSGLSLFNIEFHSYSNSKTVRT